MLAALQAPVIMMSQNRQNSKDRLKADLEYEVNLKAELEVAQLHTRSTRSTKRCRCSSIAYKSKRPAARLRRA